MVDLALDPLQPQTGDIIAVRGRGWVSERILRATGDTVSHVGMVIGDNPPIVIEALTRVRTRPLGVSVEEAERSFLLHDKSLTAMERTALVDAACTFSADGYGYGAIVLQLADALVGTRWFTEHGARRLHGHPICSALVSSAAAVVGRTFAVSTRSVTPADVLTFARAHPDIYTVQEIYSLM